MSRRKKKDERREHAKNRAPTAGKISPAAASPNLSAADDRPDALRPWLLFGATTLIVARPFVTSDGGPWMGDGEPFAALWIILVILWTLGCLADHGSSCGSRGPMGRWQRISLGGCWPPRMAPSRRCSGHRSICYGTASPRSLVSSRCGNWPPSAARPVRSWL